MATRKGGRKVSDGLKKAEDEGIESVAGGFSVGASVLNKPETLSAFRLGS